MPTNFEFEFSQQDKELILTQELSEFNGTNYIGLTIFPNESLLIGCPFLTFLTL